MEYKELLNKANVEMKKVVDFIKENEDMFGYMDLKCHDVSYYCCKDMEKDFPLCYAEAEDNDYFSWFCKAEYECFLEWCDENNIDFDKMRHQLGRTSSFYLQNWYDKDIDFMLYNIIGDVGYWYTNDYFNLTNGVITSTDIEDYEDETIESLEYIANEFYIDFINEIEDIKKVYDYISDFKKNQVEIFKDYLVGYEDMLHYETEKEKKENAESKQKCIDIQNKYDISNEDMNTLKENILHF